MNFLEGLVEKVKPAARKEYKELENYAKSIDNIDNLEKVYINDEEVEVYGNDRISKETIFVYGDVTLNSDYSSIRINDVLKNLYSTGFFESLY